MRYRFLVLLATLGSALLLHTGTAYAFVAFTEPIHRLFVFLHVFGAIIFLGNIIVSAMWMVGAKRTGDVHVLHFAAQSVVRGDRMFTLPGLLLILGPGLLIVGPWGGIPGTSWAELALALLILSGAIWLAVLIRLQKRMVELTRAAAEAKEGLDEHFYKLLKAWTMWGGIATLLPLLSFYLMVFKPKWWG
ncbi:MAG: DUF2269 domain-containing protein [Candidatus Krumholzibacteria bacterium]|nr:DUF2269 domain-containing protein [Candidatus Krumholzibacteria bacterium]